MLPNSSLDKPRPCSLYSTPIAPCQKLLVPACLRDTSNCFRFLALHLRTINGWGGRRRGRYCEGLRGIGGHRIRGRRAFCCGDRSPHVCGVGRGASAQGRPPTVRVVLAAKNQLLGGDLLTGLQGTVIRGLTCRARRSANIPGCGDEGIRVQRVAAFSVSRVHQQLIAPAAGRWRI